MTYTDIFYSHELFLYMDHKLYENKYVRLHGVG